MNDTMPTLQERLQDANMKWGAILMWKGILIYAATYQYASINPTYL
jgi:hypothetical protein